MPNLEKVKDNDINFFYFGSKCVHLLLFDIFIYSSIIDNELTRFSSGTGTEADEEMASSPYFDLDNSGNVTAVLGKTAYLNCRVKNIKNQTVRINS